MILAQGLVRHVLGREWRWPEAARQQQAAAAPALAAAPAEAPPRLARLLELFWDTPAERNPFSLHSLCRAGQACGVVAGRWLGPWVMCKTLAAAAGAARRQGVDLGLTVAVLAESGGGAPLLVTSRFEPAFGAGGPPSQGQDAAAQQGQQQEREQRQRQQGTDGSAAAAAELVPVGSGMLAVEPPSLAASVSQLTGGGGGGRGLVLLVPLVLGLGKLNPRYIPQLEAVLAMPQSIGIVGGRPSSSLYFVGFQHLHQHQHAAAPAPAAAAAAPAAGAPAAVGAAPAEAAAAPLGAAPAAAPAAGPAAAGPAAVAAGGAAGREAGAGSAAATSSVIYLDPHQVQEAAACPDDWRTFWCETPRSMPLPSIDPSLALGFYCSSLGEYRDLCSRLEALERRSGGAPLVCVATQAAAARYASPHETEWEPDELSSEGEEEEEGGAGSAEEACQEEPVVLQPDVVAEAEAAVPSPPPAAARGAASAGPASPAAAAAPPAPPRSGPGSLQPAQQQQGLSPQQQQAGQQQGGAPGMSPRQMSRGWELL
ncbi:hypothetical protein CHLNCDRAFT_143632 [Chlorella variabilis]|uniref:Cysteine protease n=1 Tax=Chlorella variabilis TaxID=554065 RepID=E1ZA53_CHLVA|nr:hypothetical protein CHLNCDRAFT_143632 [Chlorella variabilis]EFN56996.1 hypothetical protein CHLNCDRAFT_143632 [Chlorella variabilis]|eukprot:XP_005849098.1 hypothetical protein CHLNCDRAFT_143632 [Chlorella variabilis]